MEEDKGGLMPLRITMLLVFAVIVGLLFGLKIGQREGLSNFSAQTVGRSHAGDKVSTIMELIENDYVDSIDKFAFEEKVIPKILLELDPHTTYIPAVEMKKVSEEMRGNFSGIGVQFVLENDTVIVVDVISGGPSQKVGVMAGDRIIKVNGNDISGVGTNNDSIMSKLRGPKNTKVQVGVMRSGYSELIDFEITRGEIPLYSVDVAYMVTDSVGLIKINKFGETTYSETMAGIRKLQKAGAIKLIVDLRGNGGGYLQSVQMILDEFLSVGSKIVYIQGNNRQREDYIARKKGIWENGEVVVLIDEYSASASEIFAGAIQDNDRGMVVGRRSFGKGLVQEQIPLYDGSVIRLTVSRYYTPSGRCIQKPYDSGLDNYNMEIYKRIEHAELTEKDSIQQADSLKYKTVGGRDVYGGGGIMPDVFVPADTSGVNDFFIAVVSKSLIYHYAFRYADENRKQLLSKVNDVKSLCSYLRSEDVMNKFLISIKSEGIKYTPKELSESHDLIESQLFAYIGRNILGEEGFYPVVYQSDKTVLKALEVLNE